MLGALYPHAKNMSPTLRHIANSYTTMVQSLGGDDADLTIQDYDWSTHAI